MNRHSIIYVLIFLCILSTTAWADTKIHKWEDYAKPFGGKIDVVDDSRPAIVEVEFPESVVENTEVTLFVSSSISGSLAHSRILLSVNDREMGYLASGSNVKVFLKKSNIKAGPNILKFSTESRIGRFVINGLRIELKDSIAGVPSVEKYEKVYKWEDYTKPFKTKIQRISDKDPGIVEVDLPESVFKNIEVVLTVSTSSSGGSANLARALLSVNGKQLPLLMVGSGVEVILEQGIIKPGTNRLIFSHLQATYDVNGLRIELKDSIAGVPSVEKYEEVYKWEDYTKPFKTKIQRISDKDPGIVEVDLPESVFKNIEVVLTVSTSSSGGSANLARALLSVNGKQLPLLMVGSGVEVILEQGIIKPGTNRLIFSPLQATYDVNNLRIELRDPRTKVHKKTATANLEMPETQPTVTQIPIPPTPKPEEPKKASELDSAKVLETTTKKEAQQVKGQSPSPPPPRTKEVKKALEVEPSIVQEKDEAILRKQVESKQAIKLDIEPSKQLSPVVDRTDIGQRWAVVIGVSEYQDSRIPSLRYAARDAQSVYDWLVSPNGGRFAPSRVNLLLDRNATNENIKEALFSWLKQAIEEDLVVIYFAGHGSPESPDVLHNLYLLPHNTKYSSIAASGFPMWDIETALKRFIKAKRVVIMADACHSGGVGQAFDMAARTGRGSQVNPINSGLQNLTDIGEGVCVISASRDKEISREGREWGGGHGVFTHYLLEGLKGAADFDKNGSVAIGELTVYVSQQVRRATLNAQNPIVSGRFDPSLTISQ